MAKAARRPAARSRATPAIAQAVGPVGAHLEVEDDVVAEAEHIRQGAGRARRRRAAGGIWPAPGLRAEAELEGGAEHPVGPLPPHLAPADLQAAGHDGAQRWPGDQVARLHVERAAADLQGLAVAGVNVDQVDPVGGGVGPGGEDPGDHDPGQDRADFLRTLDHQARGTKACALFPPAEPSRA